MPEGADLNDLGSDDEDSNAFGFDASDPHKALA